MPMTQKDTEHQRILSPVIEGLTWFWTNAIVRRYLIASDLSRERMRAIDWFVSGGEENLPHPLDTESAAELARTCTELATCVRREVKPMLELERRRAGPDMDSARRAQLDLVLSNLEANADALLDNAAKLRTTASNAGTA